jgi:hypothetical protein
MPYSHANSSRHGSGRKPFNNNRRSSFGGNRRSGGYKKSGKAANKLDYRLFIKKATEIEQEVYHSTHTFADFKFSSQLEDNLKQLGYETPTPIQDQSIPHAMNATMCWVLLTPVPERLLRFCCL